MQPMDFCLCCDEMEMKRVTKTHRDLAFEFLELDLPRFDDALVDGCPVRQVTVLDVLPEQE